MNFEKLLSGPHTTQQLTVLDEKYFQCGHKNEKQTNIKPNVAVVNT
jgi:hypothetical protein